MTNDSLLEESWGFIKKTLSSPAKLEEAAAAGFTKKQFENALKLYNKTIELKQIYDITEARQLNATDAFEEALDIVRGHYSPLVVIGRRLYKHNREMYKSLELKGKRKNKYDEEKMQVYNFYNCVLTNEACLSDYAEKMIDKEHFEAGVALYKEMVELKLVQEIAKEATSEASYPYQLKLREIETWYTSTVQMIKARSKVKYTPTPKK